MDLQFDTKDAVQWWDSDSAPLSPEGSPLTPASELSDGSILNPLWLSSVKDNSLWAGYPSRSPQGFMDNLTLPSDSYAMPGADFFYDLPDLSSGEISAPYTNLATAAPASLDTTEPTMKMEESSTETISMPELDIEEQQSCSPASSHHDMLEEAIEFPHPTTRSRLGKKTRSGSGVRRERVESATSPRSPARCAKVTRETEKNRAKTNHNDIERKYRNRLSGQFEMLLAALSRTETATGAQDGDRAPQHHSKAEVLAMARGRIRALEKQNMLQLREMERLRREIVRLQVSAMLPISPLAMSSGRQSL